MSSQPGFANHASYPVQLHVEPAYDGRDRLTTAFRLILAIPHLFLVGGPLTAFTWGSNARRYQGGASGGVLGFVTTILVIIAWFSIVFTGRYPEGLWNFAAFYLRWRVRVVAYCALFRDEYPPFGEGSYAVMLDVIQPAEPRDRISVAFRIIFVIPHAIVLGILNIGWAVTTVIAWFAILITGSYPRGLFDFGVGVFRWNTRVEAYMLLLRDEYPPFSME
jgi:Domain of unknown function (DUF4389)